MKGSLALDLPYDPVLAIQTLSGADARMGALIHTAGSFDLEYQPAQDLFEALCQTIVGQQLSGKAASTIFGRFADLFPRGGPPDPELTLRIDADTMRSVGLSRAKAAAIKDLAEKTIEGIVPSMEAMREMMNGEILERLTGVRGIGPWTVEMLLIFRLGRPDVMPATDLGIQKGFRLVYGLGELPKAVHIQEHSERWRPYRSVASWYLWRALDLDGFAPGPVSW